MESQIRKGYEQAANVLEEMWKPLLNDIIEGECTSEMTIECMCLMGSQIAITHILYECDFKDELLKKPIKCECGELIVHNDVKFCNRCGKRVEQGKSVLGQQANRFSGKSKSFFDKGKSLFQVVGKQVHQNGAETEVEN